MSALTGVRVAVTRSREQASGLAARLVALGADVVEIPVLQYAACEQHAVGARLAGHRERGSLFVFTSVLGVRAAQAALGEAIAAEGPRAAVVGPATGEAAAMAGFDVSVEPDQGEASALAACLLDRVHRRVPIVWVRGAEADPSFAAVLRQGGFEVDDLIAYIARDDDDAPAAVAAAMTTGLDVLTFASSNTARAFVRAAGAGLHEAIARTPVAVIGPRTAEAARELGFLRVHAAESPSVDGLLGAVLHLAATRSEAPV